MNTYNCKLLANAVLISLELHRFGVSKKADIGKVSVDADKDRLKMSKKIIECAEYEAIVEAQNAAKAWLKARSMPSFVKRGMFFVSRDIIAEMNTFLTEANRKLNEELVPAFIAVYPAAVEQAAKDLNGFFNPGDYPPGDEVAKQFSIEWNLLYFSVPEGLPPEIAAQERAKLEKQFKAAEEEVLFALRESFATLINHAIDRLTPGLEGKPKRFYDTVITNITDFIDTFSARNLMNDEELKALVDKARAILVEQSDKPEQVAEFVRNNMNLRDDIAEKFEPIKAVLDTMMENRPGRAMDLE